MINEQNIMKTLIDAGFEAAIAGGAVRDHLLQRTPKDFDIVTTATPDEVEALFPKTLDIGKAFGVIQVGDFEVATAREDGSYGDSRHPDEVQFTSLERDAQRRDFTINGMFMTPEGEILDFVGGREDMKNGIIRAIGDPAERIQEDPLRMLRAFRFMSVLGFDLDRATLLAIFNNTEKIKLVSTERVRDEMLKLLKGLGASKALDEMDNLGLLELIIPEVSDLVGCQQSRMWHPEGDAYVHTLGVVDAVPNDERTNTLVMAAVLHDIGKPPTTELRDGKMTSYRHDKVGADMAGHILRRLKFTNHEIKAIVFMIRNHMKMHIFLEMKRSKRMALMQSPFFPELIALNRADELGRGGGCVEKNTRIREEFEALTPGMLHPQILLTGQDLIAMGMKPGEHFGPILKKVKEAQHNGEINNRDEAIALVKGQ